eukprot:299093-Pleurochrysis_carterae.AAC.3
MHASFRRLFGLVRCNVVMVTTSYDGSGGIAPVARASCMCRGGRDIRGTPWCLHPDSNRDAQYRRGYHRRTHCMSSLY